MTQDSATQRLSDSATQRLSDSATQRLSDSATQRPKSDPSLKAQNNQVISEGYPSLHFIVLSRYAHNLERCLQSIFKLDYPKEQIKINVVEYGHRPQKAQNLLKKYPDVSFFPLPRKSRSAAQNFLLPKIPGNLIAYVDEDVTLSKSWAAQSVNAIKGRLGVAAVSGPVRPKEALDAYLELNTSAMLVEKSSLKEIGLFRPIFRSCEGVDLASRFLSQGFHLFITSEEQSKGTSSQFPFGHYGKRLWFILRGFCRKNRVFTKALSWDGKVYVLNPSLSLCLRERDTTVVDMLGHRIFPLDYYLHEALRAILQERTISPTMAGPMRYLTESKILVQLARGGS